MTTLLITAFLAITAIGFFCLRAQQAELDALRRDQRRQRDAAVAEAASLRREIDAVKHPERRSSVVLMPVRGKEDWA